MAKNEGRKNDKLFTDFVSQDKDWRGVIDNELRCQEGWHKDWGFLADDGGKKIKIIFLQIIFSIRKGIN
jgi:hypothetical protein